MTRLGSALVFALALLSSTMLDAPAAGVDERVAMLVEHNTEFALDLYGRLRFTDGNVLFGPHSISASLAMAFAGARGDTRGELGRAMHFELGGEVHEAFNELGNRFESLREAGDVSLHVANGLWAQRDYPFQSAFLEIARRKYQAMLRQADFRSGAERVREEINAWVELETKAKISRLLAAGSIEDSARLVLISALYFNGEWSSRFDERATATAVFHVRSDESVDVQMMRQQGNLEFMENALVRVARLSYGLDRDLSMTIILPQKAHGLAAVEELLSSRTLNGWLALLESRPLVVYLPRFRVSMQLALKETLAAMGAGIAFGPSADFSGIDGTKRLSISEVVHKAFIDVNERGAEAAAATGAIIGLTSDTPPPVPVFRADQPFLFMIRDGRSGSILFLGRLSNPTEG